MGFYKLMMSDATNRQNLTFPPNSSRQRDDMHMSIFRFIKIYLHNTTHLQFHNFIEDDNPKINAEHNYAHCGQELKVNYGQLIIIVMLSHDIKIRYTRQCTVHEG